MKFGGLAKVGKLDDSNVDGEELGGERSLALWELGEADVEAPAPDHTEEQNVATS